VAASRFGPPLSPGETVLAWGISRCVRSAAFVQTDASPNEVRLPYGGHGSTTATRGHRLAVPSWKDQHVEAGHPSDPARVRRWLLVLVLVFVLVLVLGPWGKPPGTPGLVSALGSPSTAPLCGLDVTLNQTRQHSSARTQVVARLMALSAAFAPTLPSRQ
jgi:hypothetical protein